MAMETNTTTTSPVGIQPAQRPGMRPGAAGIRRGGDAAGSSPFAPRTDVNIRTSISDMAEVLSKVSENQEISSEPLSDDLQKLVDKIMKQSFSMESTLSEGLGKTLESQRFAVDQILTLSRIFGQMGALAERGSPAEMGDDLRALLTNLKTLLTKDSDSLEPTSLHRMAFRLIDADDLGTLPETIAYLLAKNSGGGDAEASGEGPLAFLKNLIRQLMPPPRMESSAPEAGSSGRAQSDDGFGTTTDEMADTEAGEAAEKNSAAQSPSRNGAPEAGAGRESSARTDTRSSSGEAENGTRAKSSDAQKNADTSQNTKGSEDSRPRAFMTGSRANASANRNTSSLRMSSWLNDEPESSKSDESQSLRQERQTGAEKEAPGGDRSTGEDVGRQGGKNEAQTSSDSRQSDGASQNERTSQNERAPRGEPPGRDAAAPDGREARASERQETSRGEAARRDTSSRTTEGEPRGEEPAARETAAKNNGGVRVSDSLREIIQKNAAKLANAGAGENLAGRAAQHGAQSLPQAAETMKQMATLLMKDATLTESDTNLLQNFVNGKDAALSENEARQLQQLIALCEKNVPSSVQQAARQQGLSELPRLWAFMELCDLAVLRERDARSLRKASKGLSDFASMMKSSLSSDNSRTAGGQRSMNFMMPLYVGDNEKPYPTYIHVYDEAQQDEKNGKNQKRETWLRVCFMTENIGAVDLTFRLYDKTNVDVRAYFSDRETVKDFWEYMDEFRASFSDKPLQLMDMKVRVAGETEENGARRQGR